MRIKVHDYEEPKFFRGAAEDCYRVSRICSLEKLACLIAAICLVAAG